MKRWSDVDIKIAAAAAFVVLYSLALWVTGR